MPRRERPELVGWEITRRCNIACFHCYSAAVARDVAARELSTEACRGVIDQLAGLGARVIGWTGGEPLVREDLEELCAYAASRRIRSGVTTNGVLLDAARARSLAEAGLSAVQVSLDGSTPKRNATIRGMSAEEFEAALEAVRCSLREGMRTNLAMVLGAETLDDAPAWLELARSLGVERVRFCGFAPRGRGRASAVAARMAFGPEDAARLREFVLSARALDRPVALFDPAFGPLPPDYGFHTCNAGVETLYLTASGAVYPCTALIHPRFEVGDVHERSLAEIWEDPRMSEISRYPCERITGACAGCDNLAECNGGCRGVAFMSARDVDAPLPWCTWPGR